MIMATLQNHDAMSSIPSKEGLWICNTHVLNCRITTTSAPGGGKVWPVTAEFPLTLGSILCPYLGSQGIYIQLYTHIYTSICDPKPWLHLVSYPHLVAGFDHSCACITFSWPFHSKPLSWETQVAKVEGCQLPLSYFLNIFSITTRLTWTGHYIQYISSEVRTGKDQSPKAANFKCIALWCIMWL